VEGHVVQCSYLVCCYNSRPERAGRERGRVENIKGRGEGGTHEVCSRGGGDEIEREQIQAEGEEIQV
jgi:hypothetical protein